MIVSGQNPGDIETSLGRFVIILDHRLWFLGKCYEGMENKLCAWLFGKVNAKEVSVAIM